METPLLSRDPDTAPGQLLHPELDTLSSPQPLAELDYSGLLRMPKRILQQLWKESLNMPEATYCMLAMYTDGVGGGPELKTFDADEFIERWAVRWETERKGKKGSVEYVPHEKRISYGTLAKVISSFEKKDRAIAKRSDLQLKITWEA